jgi:hypothetical protein
MTLARQEGEIFFEFFPWMFLPMEGFERLSVTTDDLVKDPTLSYTAEQL